MTPQDHLDAHRASGYHLTVDGVRTFVRDEGEGPAVVCMHGVPASSFLYRKVTRELHARGLRGIAFDLPGLGFADRPEDFDYTWTGLAAWSTEVVKALDLDRFHLVVHDIGGPIGIEMADRLGGRVASLTILNTLMDPETFHKPAVMRPFEVPLLDQLWLSSMRVDAGFVQLMYLQGVADRDAVSREEILAYQRQLLAGDGGRAFLQIMKGFEPTREKSALIRRTVSGIDHRQVVWGADDPALTLREFGRMAQLVAQVDKVHTLPGKHFLQEDQAPEVAQLITDLVAVSEIAPD